MSSALELIHPKHVCSANSRTVTAGNYGDRDVDVNRMMCSILLRLNLKIYQKHFNQGLFYKDEELFQKNLDVFVKTP